MADTFGDKLRRLRLDRRMTQLEASQEIQRLYGSARMSQTTLSTLERSHQPPRGKVWKMLAEYYGVPYGYFVDDEAALNEAWHHEQVTDRELALLSIYRRKDLRMLLHFIADDTPAGDGGTQRNIKVRLKRAGEIPHKLSGKGDLEELE